MKKIKLSALKKYNSFIALLLSLIGYSSCEDEYGPDEYGSPYAEFIINGKVTSASTSKAIPNIQVIMGYDTTYTDESGNYQVEQSEVPLDQTFLLELKDIDGSSNGKYADRDSTVEFTDPEFTNGNDGWYSGETTQTVNIELDDKE